MASPTARYLLLALLAAVLVTAICAWPAHAWAGADGLLALGVAGLVCLASATIARLVAGLMLRLDTNPDASARATQAAIGIRLLLTLAISLPIILLKPFPVASFGVWLCAQYLAQMVLEVFVSLRELGQNHGPTGTPARLSQPEAELPPGSPSSQRADDPEGAESR